MSAYAVEFGLKPIKTLNHIYIYFILAYIYSCYNVINADVDADIVFPTQANQRRKRILGPVPRTTVKFNPRFSQILRTVFFCPMNM